MPDKRYHYHSAKELEATARSQAQKLGHRLGAFALKPAGSAFDQEASCATCGASVAYGAQAPKFNAGSAISERCPGSALKAQESLS